MARKNVWIPDDLLDAVTEHSPDLNVSQVVQDALRRLVEGECPHHRLTCPDCGRQVSREAVGGEAVAAYYRELLHELGPLVDQLGTAEGAARIAKRVALEFGVPGAESRSLPRPPRSARDAYR